MLKKLFLLLVTIISLDHAYAQDDKPTSAILTKVDNGSFMFEKVINVANVPKDELYKRMKQWVITNVKSAENNSFDDVDKNLLSTNIVVLMPMSGCFPRPYYVDFKLSFFFKENKVRLVANQFVASTQLVSGESIVRPFSELVPFSKKCIRNYFFRS